MGMFDSFLVTVICPYCKVKQEIELQTKQFSCNMITWKEGDPFNDSGISIKEGLIRDVYGTCNKCLKPSEEDEYRGHSFFYADILIKDGFIVRAVNVRKNEEYHESDE